MNISSIASAARNLTDYLELAGEDADVTLVAMFVRQVVESFEQVQWGRTVAAFEQRKAG
jgi:hypothetical protein